MIAKIEITDHGHRVADLAEGCDPKDTVAGICPSRFRGCLRKSVPAVHPLRRRGTNVVAARRYVTSLRTADSVLATDTVGKVAVTRRQCEVFDGHRQQADLSVKFPNSSLAIRKLTTPLYFRPRIPR